MRQMILTGFPQAQNCAQLGLGSTYTTSCYEPFATEELDSMQGMQAMRDRVLAASGNPHPPARDFLHFTERGKPHGAMVGGPKEIADQLEEWFTAPAGDGFAIAGTHMPGTFADFVAFVAPELPRRGLFHRAYEGASLRENLGLKIPRHGWWKQ